MPRVGSPRTSAPGRALREPRGPAPGLFGRISPTIPHGFPTLPEGTAELNVEPLGPRRAVELLWGVFDPQKGSRCRWRVSPVTWKVVNGSLGSNINSVTDRQGRFRITGLVPDATAYLSAARGEATTALADAGPGQQRDDRSDDQTGERHRAGRPRLRTAGRPVVGATVLVSALKRSPGRHPGRADRGYLRRRGPHHSRHTGAMASSARRDGSAPTWNTGVDVEADGYTPADTG